MCVRVQRFPEFGVTLNVFSGALTHEAMMRFIDQIEPADSVRWINYLDPTLDISGLDVARTAMRKRALAAKLYALHAPAPVRSALVCTSPTNELVAEFWPRYVALDDHYPAEPAAFPTLGAACAWLELPPGACEALGDAVVSGHGQTGAGRSGSVAD